VDTPATSEDARRWQREADLLAEGRELLENRCASSRYRYLYPEGPNLGLLLAAYQELDRMRTVGRVRGGRWRQWRSFKRILERHIHFDMLDRSRRLTYRYPQPRLHRLPAAPPLVRRALAKVDTEVLDIVEAHIGIAPPRASEAPVHRGITQFRDALMQEALTHPESIPSLHPQYLWLLASAQPSKRRHPLVTLMFVRLPLQAMLLVFTLLNLAYVTAYYTFNDEVLGDFVSDRVSGLIEGELRIGSIHWEPVLIYDLLTGTPSFVVAENVDVYEPYKSSNHGRQGRAAHADRIEATLVLHEIIPWNRIGIPRLFEIPWVLHFGDVQVDEPMWFHVREYEDQLADGTTVKYIGLREAFRLYNPPDIVRRGLSFAVDHARVSTVDLDVDFQGLSGWRAAPHLTKGSFSLQFQAPDPHNPVPMEMPFAFDMSAVGDSGVLHIAEMDIPLTEVEIDRFASNKPGIPAGDIYYELRTRAAGSPVEVQGRLRDAFVRTFDPDPQPPAEVELYAYSEDVGTLADHVEVNIEQPPKTVQGYGVAASASIVGPLKDPVYTLAASGLTLDLFEEPAWRFDDVTMILSMASATPPEPWASHFGPGETRRLVTFEKLHGNALEGKFALREPVGDEPPPRGRIVMALDDDDPYFFSFPLRIENANPGQVVPDDPTHPSGVKGPELSKTLAGTMTGDIELTQLELGPIPPPVDVPPGTEPERAIAFAEVTLRDVDIVRTLGPQHDHLPKRIGVDGTVIVGPDGSIDFSDLIVTTDGARLRTDGGIETEKEAFRKLLLDLRIDDGRAFAKALGLPMYFEELDARVTLAGSFGAPSGTDGRLRVGGVGSAKFGTQASLWMDRGTVHVRAPDASLYGGHGKVDVDAELFENGKLSEDPRVRAFVDLKDVDIGQVVGSTLSGRADVVLEVGDGEGAPARVSNIRIHGKARSKALTFGGTTYHDAEIEFRLTAEEVVIDKLVLPIHRPVSPRFARGVTLPVGQVTAQGRIGLERDPELDLEVQAEGVPIAVVGRLLEVDLPLRGQIGAGTDLKVGGSARRPRVEGQVQLNALSAKGIALGSGKLEVTSADQSAQGPLVAHRELRIVGELATAGRRDKVQWTVDAVAAFGAPRRAKGAEGAVEVPVAAQLDVEFNELALATLLRDPGDPMAQAPVEGRLAGVSARVLTCNPGAPMLSDCLRDGSGSSKERTLEIDLEVDEAWMRSASTPLPEGTDPCSSKTTLCSAGPLRAELDYPMVTLEEPWRLETGGTGGGSFELSGSFDLSDPPAKEAEKAAAVSCRPPALSTDGASSKPTGTAGGAGDAKLQGIIDLETVAPLLAPYGLERAKGRLDVELRATGYAQDPRLAGVAKLASAVTKEKVTAKSKTDGTLVLEVAALPYALEFESLQLGIESGWLTVDGKVKAEGSEIEFGTVSGEHSGYALAGKCAGAFGVAAKGTVSSNLLRKHVGDVITAGPGGVEVKRMVMRGATPESEGAELRIDALEGTLALDRTSLGVEVGISDLRFDGGRIDFRRCGPTDCPQAEEGWFVVDVGGLAGASASTQPTTALRASAGPSGRGVTWGRTFLSPKFDAAVGTDLEVRLDDIPYRGYDRGGAMQYEFSVGSDDLQIRGGSPLVIDGHATVDRARYVKDAVQGVEILRLIDESQTTVTNPPPDILQGLTFNVRVETDRPLRVENNIASGVEATAVVEVTGTYEDPEFTGRIDVEPGGVVDIPFLTGTYEIQRGRVTLLREFENAEVDVLALRNEPIYIRDQPRRVQLLLAGTLSEIRWSCIADGDSGGELDTVRGCTEYLVLGTGDVQLGESDVQRFGAGGLAGVRKPLQVVGHLTEFDVGKRAGDAAPRLRPYVPDVKLRLGQIGPELEVTTPQHWFDFDYGHATFGFDYTRGYPGFLLRQSREVKVKIQILDPVTLEYSRRIRSYLNERIIFDPLEQDIFELRFDFEIPTVR
jgi:hypothetical protein